MARPTSPTSSAATQPTAAARPTRPRRRSPSTRTARLRPAFRRIHGGNTYEQTVERLLQAVKLGQVAVGERLPPERELAASLGVSRLTLREAIRALASSGFLESRRGRYGGTFVLPSHEWRRDRRDARQLARAMGDDVTDALLMREVLEPGAVELAARGEHDRAAVAELQEAFGLEQSAAVEDYRLADSRLHLALVGLAGSPTLSAAVSDNRMRLNDLLDAIPLLPPNIAHSRAQHTAVVQAVLAKRPSAARQLMAKHLEGTASLLRGFLT